MAMQRCEREVSSKLFSKKMSIPLLVTPPYLKKLLIVPHSDDPGMSRTTHSYPIWNKSLHTHTSQASKMPGLSLVSRIYIVQDSIMSAIEKINLLDVST